MPYSNLTVSGAANTYPLDTSTYFGRTAWSGGVYGGKHTEAEMPVRLQGDLIHLVDDG